MLWHVPTVPVPVPVFCLCNRTGSRLATTTNTTNTNKETEEDCSPRAKKRRRKQPQFRNRTSAEEWDGLFESLKKFHEECGHFKVPVYIRALCKFVKDLRHCHHQNDLISNNKNTNKNKNKNKNHNGGGFLTGDRTAELDESNGRVG
jgi:hypothetical protein